MAASVPTTPSASRALCAARDDVEVRVFLLGDAVACAVARQQLPDGHYHLDRMLKGLLRCAQVTRAPEMACRTEARTGLGKSDRPGS